MSNFVYEWREKHAAIPYKPQKPIVGKHLARSHGHALRSAGGKILHALELKQVVEFHNFLCRLLGFRV